MSGVSEEMTLTTTEPAAGAQPPARRHARRAWIAAVTAGAVTAAAIGVWITHRGGDSAVGADPDVIYTLAPMAAGASDFSLGDFPISAPGKDVRILSVKPLESRNVEYLGAYVVWPRDSFNNLLSGGPGFPFPTQTHRHPLDEVIPASETSFVPPGQSTPEPLTVTVGFRITSGIGAVNGVAITYWVDGKTHRQNFAQAVVGCLKPDPCGKGDTNFDRAVLKRYGLIRGR